MNYPRTENIQFHPFQDFPGGATAYLGGATAYLGGASAYLGGATAYLGGATAYLVCKLRIKLACPAELGLGLSLAKCEVSCTRFGKDENKLSGYRYLSIPIDNCRHWDKICLLL